MVKLQVPLSAFLCLYVLQTEMSLQELILIKPKRMQRPFFELVNSCLELTNLFLILFCVKETMSS